MALDIGIGLSIEKDPFLAVKEAVHLANSRMQGEKIDLAIAFSSMDLLYPGLLKTLSASLKDTPIIGASGAAIISNQGIFKHGLVIMLLGLPQEAYLNTACTKDIKKKTALSAGKELGRKLLHGVKDIRGALSILFSDGLMEEGSNFIQGLQESLGGSSPIIGASASDDLHFLKTYVCFNQELLNDAAVGILFCGKLNFGLGIKHGWKPLGKHRTVTKSQGNILYEIDNQPAVKIYEWYLGRNLTELKKEIRKISVLYPLGTYLAKEKEYLLRNVLSIKNKGSLVLQGNVEEGSLIRLMIGTRESCLAATEEALNEAKKGLFLQTAGPASSKTNNFALVFNSVSRYLLLRKGAGKELEILRNGLGEDTPIIGLYTYGEQSPVTSAGYQGKTYFHNQTIAVLNMQG